jgi:hypothetical protein
VDLAHRFETDTLQIRFDGVQPLPPTVDKTDFWISLQMALTTAAADVLVIPPRDIDGTFRSQSEQGSRGELVIYDRVPGGAGYVERIQQELPRILGETVRRTRDCKKPHCDRRAASMPFRPGMEMSSRMRSGWCFSAASKTALPSAAVATTSHSGASRAFNPSRRMVWSSAKQQPRLRHGVLNSAAIRRPSSLSCEPWESRRWEANKLIDGNCGVEQQKRSTQA